MPGLRTVWSPGGAQRNLGDDLPQPMTEAANVANLTAQGGQDAGFEALSVRVRNLDRLRGAQRRAIQASLAASAFDGSPVLPTLELRRRVLRGDAQVGT